MPTVDSGSHQRGASDRAREATHPTSKIFASSSSVAFVAKTYLPTVDAGSHQKGVGGRVRRATCPTTVVELSDQQGRTAEHMHNATRRAVGVVAMSIQETIVTISRGGMGVSR